MISLRSALAAASLLALVHGSVSAQSAAPASPGTVAIPAFDHIVVVMEENHSPRAIIGNTREAPFMNSLAAAGTLLTNYSAITHPSQPNYLALYSGSTQGVSDDAAHKRQGPTLATILQGAGKTFVGYVQTPGSERKHNPWESFPEGVIVERDFTAFPKQDYSLLPTVAFVVPNQQFDMHDGTIAQADGWLGANLKGYADWTLTHNSLLIITWDENEGPTHPGNQVPAILFGAHLLSGANAKPANHYAMLATILASQGLAAPGEAANAAPLDVFTARPGVGE